MKKFFLLLAITPFLFLKQGWPQIKTDSTIVIGRKSQIFSSILNEKRTYQLYLPPSYHRSDAPKQGFPVIYLLDGEWNFHHISGLQNNLNRTVFATLPEMIVVAINNTDRLRDLTPTHSMIELNNQRAEYLKTSGGGEKFNAFLKKELIPHIDATYHTLDCKILIGHSLGGLTALNILLKHTNLFNGYLVIDPSLWWDQQQLLKEAASLLGNKHFNKRQLFISYAKISEDSALANHFQAIRDFVKQLKHNAPKALRWDSRYFENEDHISLHLISSYYGLKFFFEGYKIPLTLAPITPKAALNTYQRISQRFGISFLPESHRTNALGTMMLKQKALNAALNFFRITLRNDPKNANAYSGLGDIYIQKGDPEKSLRFYRKALKLAPDDKAILKKIAALQKK